MNSFREGGRRQAVVGARSRGTVVARWHGRGTVVPETAPGFPTRGHRVSASDGHPARPGLCGYVQPGCAATSSPAVRLRLAGLCGYV